MVNPSVRFCRGRLGRILATVLIFATPGCDSIVDSLADEPSPPPNGLMIPGRPVRWFGTQNGTGDFEVGRDIGVHRSGSASAYIRSLWQEPAEFGALTQQIRADAYRGRRIRYAGWIRTAGVGAGGAGLWLRSDGVLLGPFDNMIDRRLTGTNDWKQVSIVVDVPHAAVGLAFGALLSGPGVVWIDDLSLEVVDTTVPVTVEPGERAFSDSAQAAAQYGRFSLRPLNLAFEGELPAAQQLATVEWVRNASFAFGTDDPDASSTDLDPLRPLVGGATLVALGEATHGTREFFRMKHRVLAWLVREMGFSYFGIEANLAEALAVDHYVQTGVGNPTQLLSDLRYWTWNTAEVMAMIEWMRAWNAAGHQPRVHFTGFDMGFAGVAIDSVSAFTSRMDPVAGTTVAQAYQCLNGLRDTPTSYTPDYAKYALLGADQQAACRQNIRSVDSLFARNDATWSSIEGAEKFRVMQRLARTIEQWEQLGSAASDQGVYVRDRLMAENVAWWHDTHAPGTKMVLWAHNGHVSRWTGFMGDHLTRKYGSRYLPVAQTFGSGSFNAVFVSNTGVNLDLRAHNVSDLREEAIEAVFKATGIERLIFDARRVRAESGPATIPLEAPLSIRSVGASYRPSAASNYQVNLQLGTDYDLIIWFRNAMASTLLPHLP